MANERLTAALQLSVLAALSFDEIHGTVIAAQVTPAHFDNNYRDFAARVLQYRRRYNRPPGKSHIADVVDQAAFGKDNTRLRERLLPELLAQEEGLNAEYAATRVQDFVRRQQLKASIIEAGDRYTQDGDRMVEDVERILHRALQFRKQTYDAGLFLDDTRAITFLDRQNDGLIALGIPELDRLGIGLVPKEMLLYIAPKGSGKTWFCIHCGKQSLLQRQSVVHYTLEMSELKIVRRYYQALFGVARWPDRFQVPHLKFDKIGRLTGFDTKRVKPWLNFTDPGATKVLREQMSSVGTRFGNLLVKEFPTGQLTLQGLEGHLDYLENVQKFVPNVLIVDYPDLMEISSDNYRIDLGRVFEGLRGVAVRRNMALLVPTQGTRKTIGAARVRSRNVSEDIRKVNTADTVLAFSRTEQEELLGLGRLSVEHVRDTQGGAEVLLAQSYQTGQYVTDSGLIQKAYWDQLRELGGEAAEEEA